MWYESEQLTIAVHYGVAELRAVSAGDWTDALDSLERHWGVSLLVLRDLHRLEEAPGREALARLQRWPVPTVAHLDGNCVGPATELALACHWRTAVGRAETRLGLAENPGAPTLRRLADLLGRKKADQVRTGPPLTPRPALRLGLIDRAWGPRLAEIHLLSFILDLSARPRLPWRWRAA